MLKYIPENLLKNEKKKKNYIPKWVSQRNQKKFSILRAKTFSGIFYSCMKQTS
jgi:hypothetical protein